MTEDELRDLAERTQEIHRITETLGWELFTDRVKAEVAHHQQRILGGRLDLDDYHREAGWVQGALAVLGMPEQAMKELLGARERFDEQKALSEEDNLEPAAV